VFRKAACAILKAIVFVLTVRRAFLKVVLICLQSWPVLLKTGLATVKHTFSSGPLANAVPPNPHHPLPSTFGPKIGSNFGPDRLRQTHLGWRVEAKSPILRGGPYATRRCNFEPTYDTHLSTRRLDPSTRHCIVGSYC